MNQEILARLADLIRETFDDPDGEVGANTVALDIPGWDSLSHTVLMLEVEQRFGVALPPGQKFANVGELVGAIEKARAAK